MERPLVHVSLSEVWATVHRALSADAEAAPTPNGTRGRCLGSITLMSHQVEAVQRLSALLDEHGVGVLADAVGMGKTYVALALAAKARAPLIVAPAVLRPMWEDAMHRAAVTARLLSFEALSRGATTEPPDLLILDEAHHARTPATQRWHALSQVATGAQLLLLSATPIHNAPNDLAAVLALALGPRAYELTPTALGALIVRRNADAAPATQPTVGAWHTLGLTGASDDIAQHIAALPPPVPARDAGTAAALVQWSLVHAWSSSDAALDAAITRRLAAATALDAALTAGRLPSKHELHAWVHHDDALQLAFPELVTSSASVAPSASALQRTLRAHADALRALRAVRQSTTPLDAERVSHLDAIMRAHADVPILAFAHSMDTIQMYGRALRQRAGVATLTSRGGRIASGLLPRRELLARFAPRAHAAPLPSARERIGLLLTTDLLSEGVNLQDAGVVVHLDLPWTPARLTQRLGRVVRHGSPHAQVVVYQMSPPAAAEAVLQQVHRLARKADGARSTVGALRLLPPTLTPTSNASATRSPAEASEWLRAIAYAGSASARSERAEPFDIACYATIPAPLTGWVAWVWHEGRIETLAARESGPVVSDPRVVVELLSLARAAEGAPPSQERRPVSAADVQQMQHAIATWQRHARLSADSGLIPTRGLGTARALATCVSRTAARWAPQVARADRAAWSTSLSALRQRLTTRVSAAQATQLIRVSRTARSPQEWIAAAEAAMGGAPPDGVTNPRHADGLIAAILLTPHASPDIAHPLSFARESAPRAL